MPKSVEEEIQATIDNPDVPFDGDVTDPEYLKWLAGTEANIPIDPDAVPGADQ